MSKLKEKAALSVGQVQAASASSSAFTQIDNFSHFYDRGDHLVNGKPSLTTDQAADQLTRSGASWHDLNGDGVINLTYTFLTAPPVGYATRGLGTFSQFSSLQKEQAKLSLESWADVAKVTFTEGAAVRGGDGHMTFANFSASNGGAAFAYLPSSSRKGESWYLINKDYEVNKTPGEGNYGRQTLTHEIGHTLGLSHPGDYNAGNGNPTYRDAVYGEDTRAYSVMSYWSESNTGQHFTNSGEGAYASAPLLDDIAAVQKLYGANLETRAGDTVYGFNSTADRDFYSATSASSKLIFSVWDGGGNDTLDFSGFSQNQKINLTAGSFSDVGGMTGNVSIAQGVTVENAIGGSGNDLLIGNSADNVLKGGAGNDIIYGGGGADTLWGGTGSDVFVFGAVSDSAPGAADIIMDFQSGIDKIDVSAITKLAGLNFVEAFTGRAGEAIVGYDTASNLGHFAVDFSGHAVADFLVNTVGQVATYDIVV